MIEPQLTQPQLGYWFVQGNLTSPPLSLPPLYDFLPLRLALTYNILFIYSVFCACVVKYHVLVIERFSCKLLGRHSQIQAEPPSRSKEDAYQQTIGYTCSVLTPLYSASILVWSSRGYYIISME